MSDTAQPRCMHGNAGEWVPLSAAACSVHPWASELGPIVVSGKLNHNHAVGPNLILLNTYAKHCWGLQIFKTSSLPKIIYNVIGKQDSWKIIISTVDSKREGGTWEKDKNGDRILGQRCPGVKTPRAFREQGSSTNLCHLTTSLSRHHLPLLCPSLTLCFSQNAVLLKRQWRPLLFTAFPIHTGHSAWEAIYFHLSTWKSPPHCTCPSLNFFSFSIAFGYLTPGVEG